MTEEELYNGFMHGDSNALARIISLIENRENNGVALYKRVYNRVSNAYRVGITGPPGVGKSTITSLLAQHARKLSKNVAIVAVDATSPLSGGALLADRLRMGRLFEDKDVFIRSMGSRGRVGGLSDSTWLVLDTMEAFGKEIIFVETVGVGQTGTDAMSAVDTCVVVLMPGSGDAIQAMKAGLLEVGDIFVLNKIDMDETDELWEALSEIIVNKHKADGLWRPMLIKMQANKGIGLEELVGAIAVHREFFEKSGKREERIKQRLKSQLEELLRVELINRIWNNDAIEMQIEISVKNILAGKTNPLSEVEMLLDALIAEYKRQA